MARRRRRRRRVSRLLWWAVPAALVALGLGVAAWLLWPFWELAGQLSADPVRQPSRLYGRLVPVRVGEAVSLEAIEAELLVQGYRPAEGDDLLRGEVRRDEGRLEVGMRAFPSPEGWIPPRLVTLTVRNRKVERIGIEDQGVDSTVLPPRLLASFYGDQRQERIPVRLDEVPRELVMAVLAAEDASFFAHPGLSLSGILRALWVNVTRGEISQGGSTLTQQLAKNLFLTHERSYRRKLREMVLALALDLRAEKATILQAYLNEIYLGVSGGLNLVGVGAASWAYFGKPVSELGLDEAATLAGLIPSPGRYSPLGAPERAKERRDWVLDRMGGLGWVPEERVAAAKSRALAVDGRTVRDPIAPYFAAWIRAEARRRHGLEELDDTGFLVLSSLDPVLQTKAEAALVWGLESLEKGWEKEARTDGPLQGALVAIDPQTGGVLAFVGGRSFSQSQFDRAAEARRQAGSAFKPVVYSSAFEGRIALPSSPLYDHPITLRVGTGSWTPNNSDGRFRGWVTAREALEQSLNVPTVRLALDVGLPRVAEVAKSMGVGRTLSAVPSLALGSVEVTPVELATVYATLAAGGVMRQAHGVVGVLDRRGEPVPGAPTAGPSRVLGADTAYLVTSVLQGVLDRGTGRSARSQGLRDPLAGKTGTTNDRRDSWFAGYSPDLATTVWVGYDDNATTRLSGARAALPIWARFVDQARPVGGYRDFLPPPGIRTATIDPESRGLATNRCPTTRVEVYPVDMVPRVVCYLHGGGYRGEPLDRSPRRDEPRIKQWLEKIFGGESGRT